MSPEPTWITRLQAEFQDAKRYRHLTERGLAREVRKRVGKKGASDSSIRDYLHGKIEKPRPEILMAIAEVLNVPSEWLITGEGDSSRPNETVEALGQRYWMDDKSGWPLDMVKRIEGASVLMSGPAMIQAALLDLLIRLADSPANGMDDEEATLDMVHWITEVVLAPIEVLYPGQAWDQNRVPFRDYVMSVLHALALLVPRESGPEDVKFTSPRCGSGETEDAFGWKMEVRLGVSHCGDELGATSPQELLEWLIEASAWAPDVLSGRIEALRRKVKDQRPSARLQDTGISLRDLDVVRVLQMLQHTPRGKER